MTTLRLGHVIQRCPPALGGAELYFDRLSRHLASHGHVVSVHSSNALALEAFWSPRGKRLPAGMTEERDLNTHRHAVRYFPGRKLVLKTLSLLPHPWVQGLTLPASPLLPSLWAHAHSSREPVDLIHASAFPYSFPLFCALKWARRRKVPFLLTPFLHLGDPTRETDRTRDAYLSPPLKYLLHAAERILVQTRLEFDSVARLGVPDKRIVLQGLGVDPAECTGGSRTRADQRWNLPDDGLTRVGHLANLSEEKGSADLLRAVCRLHERGVPCRCVLAGPVMPNFRRFWRTLPAPIRQKVHYLGVLDDAEKPDFYAALDLFALPSRSDSFGLVLLEAWANSLPCLAYRAGGPAEVVRHEQDGLLTPCGDLERLTADLQRLLQDSKLRQRFGQSGLDRVAREHRWEEKLNLVERTYYEAVRDG